MGTSRYNGFGFAATANATFAAGGLTAPGAPNVTNATEEFTVGSPATPTGAAASTLTTS